MKLVYGVGIVDVDYVVQDKVYKEVNGVVKQVVLWVCPYYARWKGMLERCYSSKWHIRYPTYQTCSADEHWWRLSNFKSWMEKQDWEGKHLDKDLLLEGNKIYGPHTCIFLDPSVNLFLHEKTHKKSKYKKGVDLHKGRIRARGTNEFGRSVHLGYFGTEEEAHGAYIKNKSRVARILASTQADSRVSEALIKRFCQGDNTNDQDS